MTLGCLQHLHFHPQPAPHLQQHQQFQQQVQQHAGHQGQGPWFMQHPSFAAQSGLHFFGQHGGVPGALLAAAGQQPFAMPHHFSVESNNQPTKQ